MSRELIETIMFFIGAAVFISFIVGIVIAGMLLICRPLDHQFKWEKKMQGLNAKNRKKEAAKRQGGSDC